MSVLSKAAIAAALLCAASPAFAFTSQAAPPLADGTSPFANSDAVLDGASSRLQDSFADQDIRSNGGGFGYSGRTIAPTSSYETAHFGPITTATDTSQAPFQNSFDGRPVGGTEPAPALPRQ